MKTGVEKIIQAKGGDTPAKNQTGVQKIIELLGGDPPGPNQTGVDKIVEILENGGGNPNSVQTITGTLAEPWGDMTTADIDELNEALGSNQATAIMQADLSSLGYTGVVLDVMLSNYNNDRIIGTYYNGIIFGTSSFMFIQASWVNHVEGYLLQDFVQLSVTDYDTETYTGSFAEQDMADYASLIPTTLTIIWHPLPT